MNATKFRPTQWFAAFALCATLLACGSGNSNSDNSNANNNSSSTPAAQNGSVNMMMSDASTEDWALIGVKVLNISLVPQGGGTPVQVYTAPVPPPMINLVELDQLAELLGNIQVPAGTYTAATLTIGGNPGDVGLTAAADPQAGFAGTPGANVPSSQIQIQGTTGAAGSMTVPVKVNFVSPLVVTANQSNALDLEFDLSHPAFLVDHVPAGGGIPIWAVNFNGPIRHLPIKDITALVLRHLYGSVTSVATDNSSITIAKEHPLEPPTTPETAITTNLSLQILADSVNGTIFYDLDAKTTHTIKDFSFVAASLPGKFVRVAARYQSNGTLVAVRIWASSSFNTVWFSPEGHVLHVNTTTDVMTIQNEDGSGIPITVDGNTEFFFRTPANAVADATPIAVGTGFIANHNLVRGFQVHITVVDPLASPLVAQTVEIETAQYGGNISSPTTAEFTYTRQFNTVSDDYTVNLDYISSNTANGSDSNSNPILGFKWWDLTYPTLADTGANAIADFIAASNGSVNFGGSVPLMPVYGTSQVTWADPANPTGWAARWAALTIDPLPVGTVATPWTPNFNGGSFGMTVPNGANTVTVDLSSISGSATLVYQVDRTNGIVTISAEDITTPAGLAAVAAHLVDGSPVKVFGLPQSTGGSGSIKAYVVFYYTGTTPK